MKIVLIAPPLMDYQDGRLTPIAMDAFKTCPPYGLYMLGSILREEGHDVDIVDLIVQGSIELSVHREDLISSQLVGITATTLSWPTAKVCIEMIRSCNPDVPIVLGGIHATMFDKYCLHTTRADYCIRGEGEYALPALCKALETGGDLRNVPNLTFKTSAGTIERTPLAPKLTPRQIADFPLPDYKKIPKDQYSGIGIESSRGCPFDCIFCSTSYRKSWRPIKPEVFAERVERTLPAVAETRSGILQILDDEFSLNTGRAIRICKEFNKRNLNPKLIYSSRANDLLDEEFVESIAPFTKRFLVGAECGYDEGLKRVGKGTTCDKLTRAATILKKHGLAEKADFSFILGLPWETKADVMKTVRFAFNLHTSRGVKILLQWYCQIPGSRLWDDQRRKDIVHEAQYDDFGFFTNPYLFRTGVKLTIKEINELTDTIHPVVAISKTFNPGRVMVEYSHPGAMSVFYPRLPHEVQADSGLQSLREVSGLTNLL